MKQIYLTVEGMSCTGCESRIERSLKELDGVRHVKADREAGAVTVMLEDLQTDERAVRSRIEQGGYEVKEAA